MLQANRSLYTPYGAYELKATYQRNLLLGMLVTISLVLLVTGTLWAVFSSGGDSGTGGVTTGKCEIEITIPPQITIKGVPPIVLPPEQTTPGRHAAPVDVELPKDIIPVADSLIREEPIKLATNNERALIVEGSFGGGQPSSGTDGGYGSYIEDDVLPTMTEFVPMERPPELIYSVKPVYPDFAKKMGAEGKVIIKALVGKDGSVLDAVVYDSSGTMTLDEAALVVAWKYKYRPAVQSDRPIAVWVTYTVDFKLV